MEVASPIHNTKDQTSRPGRRVYPILKLDYEYGIVFLEGRLRRDDGRASFAPPPDVSGQGSVISGKSDGRVSTEGRFDQCLNTPPTIGCKSWNGAHLGRTRSFIYRFNQREYLMTDMLFALRTMGPFVFLVPLD